MKRVIITICCVLAIAHVSAQFSERVEVRLHQLDVVVERRDGTPVTDLQKDDFEIRQDGVVQPITNFSLITESTATDRAVAEQQAQAAEAPRPRPPRKFVFFVDEFAMHDAARAEILAQAAQVVDNMTGADEAMIVTPAARNHVPLFFTSDKNAVVNTLDRILKQMMRLEDARPLESSTLEIQNEDDDHVLRRGDCGQSLDSCVKRKLAALRSIVAALGQLGGKKIVLVLSRSMSSVPGLRIDVRSSTRRPIDPRGPVGILPNFRDLQQIVADVARDASANNVLIYGLETYEPGMSALPGVSAETAAWALSRPSERGAAGVQDLLRTLAEATGARAFSGTKETALMFEQISNDLRSYYSLAYRETDTNQRATHRVELKVRNRPDLVVRTRRSVSPKDEKQELSDRALSALLTSDPPNALRIGVRALKFIQRGRDVEMPIEIRIPINRLTFVRGPEGHHSRFIVHIAAVGTHADFGSSEMDRAQDLVIPHEKWEKAQTDFFVVNTAARMRRGKYRVAVGVTDLASRESGFQAFSVTVP